MAPPVRRRWSESDVRAAWLLALSAVACSPSPATNAPATQAQVSSEPTVEASPTLAPSPTSAGLDVNSFTWTRTTEGPRFAGSFFERVFVGPSGATGILGRTEHAVSLTSAVRSADGLAWTEVDAFPVSPYTGIPPIAVGHGLIEASGEYVGWGDYYPGSSVAGAHVAFWWSADGSTFELLGDPEQFDVGLGRDLVVAGGTGVAIGAESLGFAVGYKSLVYTSSDRRAWTRVQHSIPGSAKRVLTDGQKFVILATGTEATPDADAVAYASSDGTSWSDPGVIIEEDARIVSGAASEAGFAAVTLRRGDPKEKIWLSRDGTEWTEVETPNIATTRILEVAAGPDGRGFLMVGNAAPSTPMLWYSGDGVTWVEISDPLFEPPFGFLTVAAGPAGIVIGGYDDGARGAASWLGRPR